MSKVLILVILIFFTGCGKSVTEEPDRITAKEKARRCSVFWQFEEPRIQLDPIEQEEVPVVIRPIMKEEK